MNRNDFIIGINNIFDENRNLKYDNARLERELSRYKNRPAKCNNQDEDSITNQKLIEYAKQNLVKEVIDGWHNDMSVGRDETTKKIITTSYDKWLDNSISTYRIPKNMSVLEVKNIIYDYAKNRYDEEKKDAIKEFEDQELKEKMEENNE